MNDPSAPASTSPRLTVHAVASVHTPPPHHVHDVLKEFQLQPPWTVQDFDGKGNIHNDSYLVTSSSAADSRQYILQRINDTVFTQPWNVMGAMSAAIEAQHSSRRKSGVPEDIDWHAIELVPTRSGRCFREWQSGPAQGYWRMMVRIPDCVTFKSLGQVSDEEARLRLAEEAGRGMAIFTSLAASIDTDQIVCPLPGYRDSRIYFQQLRAILAGCRSLEEATPFLPEDDTLRRCTGPLFHLAGNKFGRRCYDKDIQEFIRVACDHADYALTIQHAREEGRIRTTAVHGDTKLENFLFDRETNRVKALVDLDTIMPHSWLSDWGDMVRSFVNVAGECEPDLDNVQIDALVFDAVARGFLATAMGLPQAEVDFMVDAVQIITLELGVRFLTDYLRGDNYFRLEPGQPADLNKTRAKVQLQLFQLLRARESDLKRRIQTLRPASAIVV